MIESDKGWTTEYVMSIPLCRVRQILELIVQEKRDQLKFQAQLVEWQTKNVCAMFTVAARDAKQAREINKIVRKMSLPLDGEESDINTVRTVKTIDDEVQPTSYEDMEELETSDAIDMQNQPSFEAMMESFGDMATEEVD